METSSQREIACPFHRNEMSGMFRARRLTRRAGSRHRDGGVASAKNRKLPLMPRQSARPTFGSTGLRKPAASPYRPQRKSRAPETLSDDEPDGGACRAAGLAMADRPDHDQDRTWHGKPSYAYSQAVTVGPRPLFLIDDMADSPLKRPRLVREPPHAPQRLSRSVTAARPAVSEHTRRSYIAAARMGAGIIECDVTFTKDKELVCRHAQNDLHTTTTDILAIPSWRAARCKPFTPATLDADGKLITPASAECRTLRHHPVEFKRCLRQDGRLQPARPARVARSAGGTADFRPTCIPARPALA